MPTASRVTGMAYQGKWNSTDQIPERAVDSGLISRFGAIDPTDGGQTERYSLSFDRHKALGNGEFHMDAYVIKYRLKLFSNFTYFPNDPVNGDQFEQSDDRTVFGVNPSWTLTGKWGERQYINTFGLELRRDLIGNVGLYNTVARERLGTVRADKVAQTGLAAYFQNTLQWSEHLRTVAGARTDFYGATVASDLAANSGSTRARITSPKLNFIFGPFASTEYFFNYGHGFHSNDARGTTITLDPGTLAPAEKVPALVKTKGAEIGVRTEIVPGLQSSLSLWRLALASELVFAGDAGTTEASRASLRRGIEWSNRYVPRPLADRGSRPVGFPRAIYRRRPRRQRHSGRHRQSRIVRRDAQRPRPLVAHRPPALLRPAAARRGRQPALAVLDQRRAARGLPGGPEAQAPLRCSQPLQPKGERRRLLLRIALARRAGAGRRCSFPSRRTAQPARHPGGQFLRSPPGAGAAPHTCRPRARSARMFTKLPATITAAPAKTNQSSASP